MSDQQHDIAEAPRSKAADKRRKAHMPRRIDGEALDRDFRREARFDGDPRIVVARAELEGMAGAAVIGGERDLRPVLQALREQPDDDLGHGVDAQLDEETARELVPGLLRRLHLMVGGEAGGGKGVDGRQVPQAGGVTFDDAAGRESRLDHRPESRVGRIVRIPDRGPVHHLVEPCDHQALAHEARLLPATVPAAAPFIGGGRHRRARLRKDF
jgi:hypothetical protein